MKASGLQPAESAPKWWPGRTSAIISAVLVALACPFLAYAGVFLGIAVFFRIHVTEAGYSRDEDAGLAIGVGYIFGNVALAIGGALLMGAAGLFLRPGFRGRVMLLIAGLIIAVPIAATIVLLAEAPYR